VNPDPVTVNVDGGAERTNVAGDTAPRLGDGSTTAIEMFPLLPPPGVGLNIERVAVPVALMTLASTSAVIAVVVWKVNVTPADDPFQSTNDWLLEAQTREGEGRHRRDVDRGRLRRGDDRRRVFDGDRTGPTRRPPPGPGLSTSTLWMPGRPISDAGRHLPLT
jgi:hypothetical protein